MISDGLGTVLKLLKLLIYLSVTLGAGMLLVGFFVLEDHPLVDARGAPTAEDVVEARKFVRGVRSATRSGEARATSFVTTEEQLNQVVKLGTRFIPGFRGRLYTTEAEAHIFVSVPVPYAEKWINLRASAPEFDGVFTLSEVSVGRFPIPPAFALGVGRHVANVVVGEGFGDNVLSAASSMEINNGELVFNLAMDEMGSNGLMRGVFGKLRGSEMPQADDVDRYYRDIRAAMDRGVLPTEGSYLPYLLYTLEAALEHSETEGIENAYTSAIIALTLVCGANDFLLIIGGMMGSEFKENSDWKTNCRGLTLNGRKDSRRHFTTAAALQAASNRGFAVSMGEFKELYDTVKSGGFDFTDIAANNSGIRLSNRMMVAAPADWPALIARMRREMDVIVAFDDIPQIISEETFAQTYGDVDSTEYNAMIAGIEAKIDALALMPVIEKGAFLSNIIFLCQQKFLNGQKRFNNCIFR